MSKSLVSILLVGLALTISSTCAGQNIHHVYSDEIPWKDEQVTRDDSKIYSINDAIQAAASGDQIIIHEGIYREKVTIDKNNLTLQSAVGEYVLVTGAEKVTGWIAASGMPSGVMQANISGYNIETDYTQLFANGKMEMMARHPNNETGKMMELIDDKSGYAPLTNIYKDAGITASGHMTLDETTVPDVDLSGGIIRGLAGKNRHYVFGNITSSSGNAITFTPINNSEWKNDAAFGTSKHKWGWGYILHKNLTDYPGEWFVDGNILYYYPHEGQAINDTRVEIQVRERVLVLNNTSGVTLSGINFVAGNVDMRNTNGATIEKCSMRYLYPFWIPNGYGQGDSDPKGVYLSNSSDNTFKDVYTAHTWGNMFALRDGQNNTFENCVFKDLGWIAIFTSGVHINKSDNTMISKCTFGDAGRFQIRIDGGAAKVDILDSDFYGAMKVGEDAGPIEATSTGMIGTIDMKGSEIAYNKVHDVQGVPVSHNNYIRVKATAFYMEDTENYTAHHNLIYNLQHTLYDGPFEIEPVGEFLYLGPRYNAMYEPVNYYNNTIWNVDENIGIWNIRVDNWQELGLSEAYNTGIMADGHFANNIFMQGPGFKLNYSSQVITETGKTVDWATSPANSSIQTDDFNAYVAHCANWGYHFNPENNFLIPEDDVDKHFVDAEAKDFALKGSSALKGAGVEIPGITGSATPDLGALEGSDRVLHAGADLEVSDFLEIGDLNVAVLTFNILDDELRIDLGDTVKIGFELLPVNAEADVQWTTSDSTVASVTAEGMVIAKGYGSSTITGSVTNGSLADVIDIIVVDPNALSSQSIDPIRVYPNPTDGIVYFSADLEWADAEARVFSISGKEILKKSIPKNTLNLDSLQAGIYFVRVTDSKQSKTFRVVKK